MRRGLAGGAAFGALVAAGMALVLAASAAANGRLFGFNGCQHQSNGLYGCNWTPNPVYAPDGSRIGHLYGVAQPGGFSSGANYISCQRSGRQVAIPGPNHDTSTGWAWARATNGHWGWTSEAGVDTGEGDQDFNYPGIGNVPDCGDAHGPAPGDPGYPVRHGNGRPPARKPPKKRVTVNGESCLARQWVTMRFSIHDQHVIRPAHGKTRSTSRELSIGKLQIGIYVCRPPRGVRAWQPGGYVLVDNQPAGLSFGAGNVLSPAGRGATRGWGVTVSQTPSGVLDTLDLPPVSCVSGPVSPSYDGRQAVDFPPAPSNRVSLGANQPPLTLESLAPDVKCFTVGDYTIRFYADRHGGLHFIDDPTGLIGQGIGDSSVGRHGTVYSTSLDLELPDIDPGRH